MNEQREFDALERSVETFFAEVRGQETAPPDLWARVASGVSEGGVGAEVQRRRIGRGGVRRLLWAAAAAAAIAFVVFLVTAGRGGDAPVVSAEEVLRRAVVTNASPQAAGIERLVFTRVLESYSLGDWRSDEPSFEARMRSWYEAPDRWRAEGDYRWRAIDGTSIAHSSISVWDGSEVWQYDSAEERVTVHRQEHEGGIALRAHTMVLGASLPELPDLPVGPCRTSRIVDEGEVAGRAVYVLELSRRRCGLTFPGGDGKQVIWVDRETGLVLRWESYTVGGLLSSVSRVVEIEIDGAIDEARFDFVPPSGATIDDRRNESSALLGWSVEPPAPITLDEARVAATFPLVTPMAVPAGFELESVQHYWSSELARESRSHADWVLLRYVDEQGNWLQIAQGYSGLAGLALLAPPEAAQGTVEVNGVDVRWVDGTPMGVGGWEPGAMLILSWEVGRDGTAREVLPDGEVRFGSPRSVSLTTNVLNLEELTAVAELLE